MSTEFEVPWESFIVKGVRLLNLENRFRYEIIPEIHCLPPCVLGCQCGTDSQLLSSIYTVQQLFASVAYVNKGTKRNYSLWIQR